MKCTAKNGVDVKSAGSCAHSLKGLHNLSEGFIPKL